MTYTRFHFLRPTAVRVAAVVAAGVASVSLSACGASDSESEESTSTPAAGDHNEADVTFASEMIPHHAQALMMTDMAVGRELDKEVAVLVDDIRAAQAPEIELMADWLQEWGEPVPETVRDHAHGGHDGGSADSGDMAEMDGMMTDEQLAELEDAPAGEFEELWLSMMIEHHEGAVAMAETELQDGSFQPAVDLAEEIASSQTAEIEKMQGMLDD